MDKPIDERNDPRGFLEGELYALIEGMSTTEVVELFLDEISNEELEAVVSHLQDRKEPPPRGGSSRP